MVRVHRIDRVGDLVCDDCDNLVIKNLQKHLEEVHKFIFIR
jgi:hypothetical protein